MQEPWRLALELARQWNQQIPGEPLHELIDSLSSASGHSLTQPLEMLAAQLSDTLPGTAPALLLLDTLEELLIPHRGTLVALLGMLKLLHDNGGRFAVILSGRYDLRARLGAELAAVVPPEADLLLQPFNKDESQQFLTEFCDLHDADKLAAIVTRAEGNPLKLSLYAEIVKGDPSRTAAAIRTDPRVDVAYLIHRVILRIGENERDPATGKVSDLLLQLRWVLRYGAIPTCLTYEFLTRVMAPQLERELYGEKPTDKTERGLSPELAEKEPFARASTKEPIPYDVLWERLKQYAGEASWVRVVSRPGEPDALDLTADVLGPMRDLLQQQEETVFRPLHASAKAYFLEKAGAETDPNRKAKWLRQAVYHDFQRSGAAAGRDWSALIESEEFRRLPTARLELAEEVTGRAYAGDAPVPAPVIRQDGSPMIATADLVLAYFHKAEAHITLAAEEPDRASTHWMQAAEAASLLDSAALGLDGPMPRAAAVLLVRALVLGRKKGEEAFALTLLRVVRTLGDAGERRRALVAAADLRARLGRRDAAAAYTESLGPSGDEADDREARAGRASVLGQLARELLAYDQVGEALVRCEEAMDAASEPPDEAALADLGLLYRRLLLRAGRPVAAVVSPRLTPDASPAAGMLIVEALLDQLDPTEALNRFLALPGASNPGAASPNAPPGSPTAPALLELRGRIAAELMDFRTAIDSFEAARSGWVSLGSSPDADRVLALTIELHMRGLGDLIKAGSLLRPVHAPAGQIPSETDLRLELLRAEHASRSKDIDTARQIVDHLLAQVTPEWPPHYRVLLALESLAVGGRSSEADITALADALCEITPASARAAMLPPLERLSSFKAGPFPGANRVNALVPDLEDPSLSPREQALLSLRVVEVLRILGRPDDAIARLEQAVTVLTGPGQTLFPLRALLLAGDRLGRHAESFKLGAELLPRFKQEFRDQLALRLMAALEQGGRAWAVGDGPAAKALFDEVHTHLKAQPPESTQWFPQLLKIMSATYDKVLGAAVPTLPDRTPPLLEQALEAARAIGDEGWRARALAALAPYLTPPLLEQALAAARAIGDEGWRARALAALAPHLTPPERDQALRQALAAARAIGDEGWRARALAVLAPHLTPPERDQALRQAIEAARAIGDEESRARALAALAPYLTPPLLEQALAAARAIGDEGWRARALAALAPHLTLPERDEALRQALAAARAIKDEESRAEALAAPAPHLTPPERDQALAAARAIGDEGWRARALAALAPHLTPPERDQALEAARAIGDEGWRARALAALVPHLTPPERDQALRQAIEAARAIGDEESRARALAALAPYLTPPLLDQALAAARVIGDEGWRARALAALAPHLALPERDQALRRPWRRRGRSGPRGGGPGRWRHWRPI